MFTTYIIISDRNRRTLSPLDLLGGEIDGDCGDRVGESPDPTMGRLLGDHIQIPDPTRQESASPRSPGHMPPVEAVEAVEATRPRTFRKPDGMRWHSLAMLTGSEWVTSASRASDGSERETRPWAGARAGLERAAHHPWARRTFPH
jgi:hypothetical protein